MSIPTEMTAAVLHAPGDLRIEKVRVPEPDLREVLIRVGACGICGSDVPRVMTKGTYSFPLIPGHEFAGTIVRAGRRVDRFKTGQRVAVFPLIPCRKCAWCKQGVYEVCNDYDYLGSRRDGAFAEYVAVHQWNLVEVPAPVSLECAAMAEPTAVALHALKQVRPREPKTVAIFGAGPIGVIAAQWAELAVIGAEQAWIVDIRDDRLQVARELTDATCVNGAETDAVEVIRSATDGRGVDLALEAAGVAETVRQCIAVTTKFGDVVLMGNQAADVTIPVEEFSQILRKELVVHGTWNSFFSCGKEDDWWSALMAMTTGEAGIGDFAVRPLITHRYRIDRANEAFGMMAENREFYNKVMFVFD